MLFVSSELGFELGRKLSCFLSLFYGEMRE